MIEGLQPYSEYRDSTASWFGDVPVHWNVKRLGSVFAERGETNERREVTEILSVLKYRGVIPYSEKGRIGNKASDDIGRYKIVRPDDLVVNCMNVIIGSLGRSRYTGCLSPVYYVLRRRDPNHDPRYLELVFQHKPFHESLIRIGNGILAHRMRIPMEKLKAEMFPLPPPEEQLAIVRFLDHANRKIDGFIRAKRKLIGLLNEQKQAIIHRAVTRGLDPNAKLKPSGIPWLGEIPVTWTVMRLKSMVNDSVAGPYGSSLTKAMYVREGYRVYGQQQVIPDDFKVGEYYITPEKFALMRRYQVYPDDVLVSVMGTVGRVAVVPEDAEPGIINPRLVRYRPNLERVRSRYLQLTMQAPSSRDQLLEGSKGTTMDGLNMGILGRLLLVIPPLHEQDEILSFVNKETATLTAAIARTEREIALMQEYRTRLTADIVTGKLDVREAAAKLPEIAIESGEERPIEEETEEVE